MSGDHTVNPAAAVWLVPGHAMRLPLAHLPTGADTDDRAA